MSISTTYRSAITLAAMLAGTAAVGGVAAAGPLPSATAADASVSQAAVQPVRHGRWGGVGITIGPSYGYYPSYGSYYDDDDGYDGYDYSPRRSYSYDRYYRPYRTHSRRWVKERFEHPLGRR
jgi:hypothetical protein